MLLCKQTEHPNCILRIKIDSQSIIKLEAWPIIDFEKLDRFPPLPDICRSDKIMSLHNEM